MRIPNTIAQATEALAGIESLLTKKGWERAAILAAFVRKDRKESGANAGFHSAESFAKLGIAGLSRANTVLTYVNAWLDEHDGIYPEPGAEVELPDGDYPPGGPRGNTQTELIQSAVRKGTLVEQLTPEQRVEVASSIIDVMPPEHVAVVSTKAFEREQFDADAEAIKRGGRVPTLDEVQPPRDGLDGLIDAGVAEADLLDAMGRVVTLARRVGHLAADHPTALRMQTMWMEVASFFVVVNSDARRVD